MGAKIAINGKTASVDGVEKLHGAEVEAHDLRAGAALVLAGFRAEGETEISEIYHIERGYSSFEKKLVSIGGKIRREDD